MQAISDIVSGLFGDRIVNYTDKGIDVTQEPYSSSPNKKVQSIDIILSQSARMVKKHEMGKEQERRKGGGEGRGAGGKAQLTSLRDAPAFSRLY